MPYENESLERQLYFYIAAGNCEKVKECIRDGADLDYNFCGLMEEPLKKAIDAYVLFEEPGDRCFNIGAPSISREKLLIIEILANSAGFNATQRSKSLLYALNKRCYKAAEILLKAGADINDERIIAALFNAARGNDPLLVGFLLRNGIDYTTTDQGGDTALNVAPLGSEAKRLLASSSKVQEPYFRRRFETVITRLVLKMQEKLLVHLTGELSEQKELNKKVREAGRRLSKDLSQYYTRLFVESYISNYRKVMFNLDILEYLIDNAYSFIATYKDNIRRFPVGTSTVRVIIPVEQSLILTPEKTEITQGLFLTLLRSFESLEWLKGLPTVTASEQSLVEHNCTYGGLRIDDSPLPHFDWNLPHERYRTSASWYGPANHLCTRGTRIPIRPEERKVILRGL